ncbi:MAG: hypothetical protein ACFE9Y_08280 [Promethearchaeota archaeon]
MYLKRKIAISLIFCLLVLSIFTVIPLSKAAPIESGIGHKFSEEYWSILYDFAGGYLEEDYNPGPSQGDVSEGLTDNNTITDSKFFIAWNNIQNVQSLYIAMQNYTWDNTNRTNYGCAPYQLLIQHFRPPGQTNIHIFVLNTFFGLLAYREDIENPGIPDIPDQNDKLYMGWSYYSEYHKFITNLIFLVNGIPRYMWFDNETRTTAVPIPMEETEPGIFKYGMSYKNIFILWQKVNVTEGLDNTVTQAEILQNCSAFALLSELNFTYVISQKESTIPGFNEISTTTEYDIGEITDLWVVGDNGTVADNFGGENISITIPVSTNIGYYNGTAAAERISGNSLIPGFSLAVINHVNIIVMDLDNWQHQFQYSGNTDFIDENNNTLGASAKNITEASYDFMDDPAYKIDFASKPNYTLNGTTEYPAPTRVLRNDAIPTPLPLGFMENLYIRLVLAGIIANLTGSKLAGLIGFFSPFLDEAKFFYLTCFPVWSGSTINQDPTFTVYVEEEGRRISGYGPLTLFLIGISGISLITFRISKKKKFKI